MSTDLKSGAQAAPVTELLKGIVTDVGELVRQEVRFARKEIASDLRKSSVAATRLAIGAAVALVGVFLLGHTLALALYAAVEGLPLWGAYAIVSVALLAIGGGVAYAGYAKFQTFTPLPDKTLATISENVTGVPQPLPGSSDAALTSTSR
ncbi:MAG: phage holin family protein [Gemmataceae bacterium]|nr:phage holin family protein [Gemmataceae bacterium]